LGGYGKLKYHRETVNQVIRMGNPLKLDLATVFFSLPLDRAKEIAARVAAVVVTQASGGRELLDEKGYEVLRDALAHEFPHLSVNDLFSVVEHVGGNAHMLAAVEWRNAGHRPGDTPEIGLSTLGGGLLIQLHATPESLPAQLRATEWADHAMLYKHRFIRPSNPTKNAKRRSAQLLLEYQQSLYDYWQELGNDPG
jgi:hypothetical protein